MSVKRDSAQKSPAEAGNTREATPRRGVRERSSKKLAMADYSMSEKGTQSRGDLFSGALGSGTV